MLNSEVTPCSALKLLTILKLFLEAINYLSVYFCLLLLFFGCSFIFSDYIQVIDSKIKKIILLFISQ